MWHLIGGGAKSEVTLNQVNTVTNSLPSIFGIHDVEPATYTI